MSNYNSTSEDYTPAPLMDQHLVVLADMTREQAARLIARLAAEIAENDTVTLRLDFDRRTDFDLASSNWSSAYTALTISPGGSSLFGAQAKVTDHAANPINR